MGCSSLGASHEPFDGNGTRERRCEISLWLIWPEEVSEEKAFPHFHSSHERRYANFASGPRGFLLFPLLEATRPPRSAADRAPVCRWAWRSLSRKASAGGAERCSARPPRLRAVH